MKKIKRNIRRDAETVLKKPPTEERIRQRAHEIFQARGGAPGQELEDWLQAERELKAEMRQPPVQGPAGPDKPRLP